MSESESDDSVMDVTVHTISPGDQIVCGMCKQPVKCSMVYSHFKYYCQQSPQFHKEKAEAKKKKAQSKETKETIADKNELVATMLGPGKGSRKVWNKTPDLQRTAAEVDNRLCLPEAVCSLIKDD